MLAEVMAASTLHIGEEEDEAATEATAARCEAKLFAAVLLLPLWMMLLLLLLTVLFGREL